MRTLFIIVGLLGLFLGGLGWSEYRAACGGLSQINDVELQYMKSEELKARQEGKGVMFNVLESDYNLSELKTDSLIVGCFGAAFFLIGTTGIFVSCRTAKKPLVGDSLPIQ